MSKHTPGPWKIELKYENGTIPVVANGDKSFDVALVDAVSPWSVEANAHLIAAAPTMLEALKSLFAESGAGMGIAEDEIRAAIGNTNWNCLQLAREKAQQAIKLAEGDL